VVGAAKTVRCTRSRPVFLERLSTTIAATADLVEAEGRLVRRRLAEAGAAGLAVAGCALVVTLGLLSVATGAVWLLAESVGTPAALVLGGIVVAAMGGLGARIAYRAAAGGGAADRKAGSNDERKPNDLALRTDAA